MAEEVQQFSSYPKKKLLGSLMTSWSTEQFVAHGAPHKRPPDQEEEQRDALQSQKDQKKLRLWE